MRRILFALVTAVIGCSGSETAAPADSLQRVESVILELQRPMLVGGMQQLRVTLRDASGNVLSNRPVIFTSSDVDVATVDASGVVRALNSGYTTITATSDGKRGQISLHVVRPSRTCAENSPLDICIGAQVYLLVLVDDQPLPVHSPWGIGDWDYDADAGTWQLTEWSITLFVDGVFSQTATHRAASGATAGETSMGRYARTSDSVRFSADDGGTWTAQISGNRLIIRNDRGPTFTFERYPGNQGS